MDAAHLQRLSALLDRALELPDAERDAWVASLRDDDAALAPTLRRLLARAASGKTTDFLERPAPFTVAGAEAAGLALAPGDVIGAYRLLQPLGRGGMGEVWLAERIDGSFRRKVALKLPHVTWEAGLAARFARERDILAALEHPNIARLYDAGADAHGRPYMALEYVEGEPLDVYCRARGLPSDARVRLLLQVADAVAFAHAQLVLHRDLKPGNLLVTADGHVRLLDFGIAKLMAGASTRETVLTQAAGRALTLDYASPEQIRGEPLGTASDVYSLGVVAYELLAGTRPYRLKRGSAAELEEAITGTDVPLASTVAKDPAVRNALRGDLDAILNMALKKHPSERYATIDGLAQDLARHMRGEPVLARPDRAGYRLRKFVLRNRLAVGAAAAVFVAIVSGAGLALWQASVAQARSAEASTQAALAKKEAQRAQAAQGFMLDLFRTNTHQQTDPIKAQHTTARELLDIGAERVSVALKDAPESEMVVLNTLSDMYVQLGLRDRAIALQRRSVDVARRVFGTGDPGRADAILGYVATLQERSERTEIPALLAEARAALDAAGETTTFLRGALLLETARYAKLEGFPAARDTADAAVAFFRQYHPQRASLITCHRLAGQARIQVRDFAGAEASFRAAVDAARLRGNAAPAWLVGSLADLGEAEQAQLAFAQADASLREALALSLQVNGDTHRETLLNRLKVANLLLATGRTDEGLALRAAVQAAIDQAPERYDANWRVTAVDLMGTYATGRGRPQDAAAQIEADVETLRATYPRSNLLAARELSLAESWVALGRLAEARRILERAIAHRRDVLAGAGDVRAWLPYLRVQARLARAEGKPVEALAALADVPPDLLATQDVESIAIAIERAHALRSMGRNDEAAAAADRALRRLQSVPAPYSLPALEASAWVAAGEAALAQGQPRAARDALAHALALRRAHDAPGSLGVAEVERALAALDGAPRVASRQRATHTARAPR